MKIFGEIFYTDLQSLYPEEAITTFGNLERAEKFYLDQEKTQGMIQRIINERIFNPLAPIEVHHFTSFSLRDKEFHKNIDQLLYTIENGHHRYIAYKAASVYSNIPTRLRIM